MGLLSGKEIVLGTCYYPEHWPERLWEEDLERMEEAGIRVIRIAEFAWSKVEPEEGMFTFEFFDHCLDLAEKETDAGDFLHPNRYAPCLADGKISGGAECPHGRGAVPPRLQKAL